MNLWSAKPYSHAIASPQIIFFHPRLLQKSLGEKHWVNLGRNYKKGKSLPRLPYEIMKRRSNIALSVYNLD